MGEPSSSASASASTSSQSFSIRRVVRQHGLPLSPVILLLLVMAAGLAIYGIFIDGLTPVLPEFRFQSKLLADHQPPNSFVEGKHRLLFNSSAFLQIVTIIGSAGFAFAILTSHLGWKSRRFHVLLRIGAFAALAVMLVVFLSDFDSHSRLNLQIYSQTMKEDPRVASESHPLGLLSIKVFLSTLSFWSAFLLAGAAAAVSYRILRARNPSAIRLRKTGRAQTSILVCGAALLVAQVLSARAFEFWITDYAPESLAKDAAAMGDAVVFGIGIFSSVALAAIYLPAHAIVVARVRITAYQAVGKRDPQAANKWIASHGLHAKVGAQIGKVTVLLGPALTGGFFEVLGKI